MICPKCRQIVTDAVICTACKGNYHFACAGLAETTYRKMPTERKASWRCIPCRTGVGSPVPGEDRTSQRSLQKPADSVVTDVSADLQHGIATVLGEIKELRGDLASVKSDLAACKNGIQNIEIKFNEMESRVSLAEDRLTQVEKKTDLVGKLQADLNSATAAISTLQQENDAREQYSRMNNVEISGLPFTKGENLVNILHDIYTVVGLTFKSEHIDCIHRVRRFQVAGSVRGGGNGDHNDRDRSSDVRAPAIIVKFTRRIYKDELLSAVRARRGITTSSINLSGPAVNMYLGDHLTPASKLLLKRARELKRDNKLAYLWIRDCKILARRTDTSKVLVINKNFDFNKLN